MKKTLVLVLLLFLVLPLVWTLGPARETGYAGAGPIPLATSESEAAYGATALALPVVDIPRIAGITPKIWREAALAVRRRTHPLQTGRSANPGVSLTLGGHLPPGVGQEALFASAQEEIVENHRLFRGLTRVQAERLKTSIGDSVKWDVRWDGQFYAMYYDSARQTFVIVPEKSFITLHHYRDENFSTGKFDDDPALGRAMVKALRHYAHANEPGKRDFYLPVGTFRSIHVEIRHQLDFPETVIDPKKKEATIILSRAIDDALQNPETSTEKAKYYAEAVLISAMGRLLQPVEEDDVVEPRALEVFAHAFGLEALLTMHARVDLDDRYLARLLLRTGRRGLDSAVNEIVLLNEFSEPLEFSSRVVRSVLETMAHNRSYALLENSRHRLLLRQIPWGNTRSFGATIFYGLWDILPNRTYVNIDVAEKRRRLSPA